MAFYQNLRSRFGIERYAYTESNSGWVVSENPNGNTDYADDVTQYVAIGEVRVCNSGALFGTIFIVFSKYFKSK